jgi:hypothetical protein
LTVSSPTPDRFAARRRLSKRIDSTALTVGLLVACPPVLWICLTRACAYCVKTGKPVPDLEANRRRPHSWPQTQARYSVIYIIQRFTQNSSLERPPARHDNSQALLMYV